MSHFSANTIDASSPVSAARGDWPGVVEELCPAPEPCDVFRRFCHMPHCVFFDSVQADPHVGRYSFIAADPLDWLVASPDDAAAWEQLSQRLKFWRTPTLPDLPPFQGGLAGIFSYDLSRSLERLPRPKFDEFQIPGLAAGAYDVVVAFDHVAGRAWIVSQGFPELEPHKRRRRAEARAAQFRRWVDSAKPQAGTRGGGVVTLIAPQFPAGNFPGLSSNFAPADYLAIVRRAIEYIYAGDVFQVNLAQRLLHSASDDSISLYLRMRERNPAPFAAYFDLGDFQIVSASPERFLKVRGDEVEARPIKGTRRRTGRAEDDRRSGEELRNCEKDRAENVMIVDLMRNDLSRVCQPRSVVVSELCRLEQYAYVQHLVSVVNGRLRAECGPLDLLRCAFPGGSVTGAPKIRAMQIITELEAAARGAYCGALAYLGFDGSMDASILIRTITAGGGWWQLPVGGGIVADSDPEREYDETWQKAEGMLRALR